MIYRKAVETEIKKLVELRINQLRDEGLDDGTNIDYEVNRFFEESIKNKSLVQYVVEKDGDIIVTGGVIIYNIPPSYSNSCGKVAYITNMYTKKEYRGRGIATNILKILVEEIKKLDCKVIKLIASEQGRSVYKKFGFEDVDNIMIMKM